MFFMDRKIGIIDIGSNTIRLVIYELHKSSFQAIENYKVTARLGKHFDEFGALTAAGIRILNDTLHTCQTIIQSYDNCEVRCLATAALRMAKNRKKIIQTVKNEIGFTIEVLEDTEEAIYGCLSVTESLPYDQGITIDLGGASTEITLFKERKLVAVHSFSFGAVTLKEAYATGALISLNKRKELRNFLKRELETIPWLKNVGGIMAGLGGNARQLARLAPVYEEVTQLDIHAAEMESETLARMRTSFSDMDEDEMAHIKELSRERLDLINIVLEVFFAVGEWADVNRFIASTRGIREGVIYEMLQKEKVYDVKTSCCLKEQKKARGTQRLLDYYQVDRDLVRARVQLFTDALHSFRDADVFELGQKERFLAEQAAALFYIGKTILNRKIYRTTYIELMNATFDGYTQSEKLRIVLMASFKNNKSYKQMLQPYKNLLSEKEVIYTEQIGALIKFCNTFIDENKCVTDIEMKQQALAQFKVRVKNHKHAPELMKYSEKQKKHVEQAFSCSVQLLVH